MLVIAPVRVSSSVPSGVELPLFAASRSDFELLDVLLVDGLARSGEWFELELESEPLFESLKRKRVH